MKKFHSHTVVCTSLRSTTAVSLVLRIKAHSVIMPFLSTKRCAYTGSTTAGRRQMMSKQHNWYHLIACSATSTVVVNCALNSFGQQRTSKATAIDKGGGSSTAARSFW